MLDFQFHKYVFQLDCCVCHVSMSCLSVKFASCVQVLGYTVQEARSQVAEKVVEQVIDVREEPYAP